MNPQDAFDRILVSLHDAMLDDAHWPATSALVDKACRIKGNMLVFGKRRPDGDVQVFLARFCHRGERRQDWERLYYEVYHALDPRPPRLNHEPDGRLVPVAELYTDEERKASPVFNEALPLADSQNSLNVRMDGPQGSNIIWCPADPLERGGWGSDQTRMIESLLPHIRQFAIVRQALADAHALSATLSRLLDNFHIGVIYLERSGRIVEANDRARAHLRLGDGLVADRDGCLSASSPAEDARLKRLLARALPAVGSEAPASGSMTVGRLLPLLRLVVHVSPLNLHRTDYGTRGSGAMVLVVEPGDHPPVDPALVAETLGLTPAESQAAVWLASGRTVHDLAVTTGRRDNSVRFHLKRIYRKLGISSQAELVRLVLTLARSPLPRS